MYYNELKEYSTKNNEEIKFQVHEDVHDQQNNSWTVDKIDAFVNGEEVGYIKISYIKEETFKEHFPSILHYLEKVGGKMIFKDRRTNKPLKDFSDEELKYTLDRLEAYRVNVGPNLEVKDERLIKRFEDFKDFHVGKPFVDYIRVHKKRQGVGLALYLKATEWLYKTLGKPLYASTLQSDEAEKVWDLFEKKGWVSYTDDRRYLDYNKIPKKFFR